MPSPSDIDIEKGLGEAEATTPGSPPASQSELEIFQSLVGIHFLVKGGGHMPISEQKKWMIEPPSPLADIFAPSKLKHFRFRNRGLYDRALSQELKNRTMYTISHYMISALYLQQILLAATFTALSAYKHISSIPLTTLGALNTVIAGLLAWLTGQGMPVRFRAARDQYRELTKDIEETERLFAEIEYTTWEPGKRPDPVKERNRLEKMYKDCLVDQQANYPEAHNTPTADKKKDENKELQAEVAKGKEKERKLKGDLKAAQESSHVAEVTAAAGSSRQINHLSELTSAPSGLADAREKKASLEELIRTLPENSGLGKRLKEKVAELEGIIQSFKD